MLSGTDPTVFSRFTSLPDLIPNSPRLLPVVCVMLQAALFATACGSAPVTAEMGGASNGGSVGNGQSSGGNSGSSGGDQAIALPDAAPAGSVDMGPPAACAAEAHNAETVPLDLMLLVDASQSMQTPVGQGLPSKWNLAQVALTKFLQDPKTAGLGVGLNFFPRSKECKIASDCGSPPYNRCLGLDRCVDQNGVGRLACYPDEAGVQVCPSGLRCVVIGTCSTSRAECMNVGQPCPMGDGTCTAPPKFCPPGSGLEGGACNPALYESATVPIVDLTTPSNLTTLLRALQDRTPDGGTPMRSGVEGALKQLRAHLAKNPGRKAVLVLATDGEPSCVPVAVHGISAVAELIRMAQKGEPAIATYVVGVYAPGEIPRLQPQVDQLAKAGGTTQAFVLTANGDLGKRLQEALDTIRGAALPCDFQIPPPKVGAIDFAKVNVRYTPTGAAQGELPYVKSLANCDPTRGGWYYDVDPTTSVPTRVLVCPSTCQQFKKDSSAKVELLFGCATRTID